MYRVLAGFFAVLLLVAFYRSLFWAMGKSWFWLRTIRRFEASDILERRQPGVIVFTGSSSINFWKDLPQDMAPLKVVNRGFGGSQMAHLTHYATKIATPYSPSAVVVYAGENDLAWPYHKTPETVLDDFQEFVDVVHQHLPTTWIYFLSIKPTLRRWKQWNKQQQTNRMIEDFCRRKGHVQFVDVSTAMLDSSARPRPELFKWDGLHPSKHCYTLWRSIIRPILLERFGA
jgi:lysophospholipase L1-like esterase